MQTLTIDQLDELTLGIFADQPLHKCDYAVQELVPFIEWSWLQGSPERAVNLRPTGPIERLRKDLRSGNALSIPALGGTSGFIRIRRAKADVESSGWLGFLSAFSRAATATGLGKTLASQLTGVVKEMEDNVHEHSGRASSGLVAFAVHPTMFEFIVCDRGIGVLASLRQAFEFADVTDHGTALRLAVSDGKSRYGATAGRGSGFSDLTVGVANSNALVRFRSGDHLLELDGRGSGTIATRCVQRAGGRGFLIAVQVGR